MSLARVDKIILSRWFCCWTLCSLTKPEKTYCLLPADIDLLPVLCFVSSLFVKFVRSDQPKMNIDKELHMSNLDTNTPEVTYKKKAD